ncbi:SH3 domain-containing protein, partial [Gallibacterium anatis]|uniref:SH3 domain-containing protein n=1 Tax=Gallibacterium anatis TaxID=750 RepID=UPI000BD3C672
SISEIFTKLNLKLNKSYAILEALTGVNSTVSIVNEQYGSNEADINSFSNEEKQAVSDLLDGKSVCYLSPESRKKVFECLGWFYHLLNIIALVCTITGISVPQLLGYNLSEVDYNEKLELLCGKVPELSKLPAEVRETYLDSGSLNIRKYDNKKADVIYQLDNGERFCVISPPKNNAQWLKVAVKTANGDTLIGYVARKYTKKVNYHF